MKPSWDLDKSELASEIERLRAILHRCHDQLHDGKVDEAHEQLHCLLSDKAPDTGNVTLTDAARIAAFTHSFNELCQEHQTKACTVMFVPSATKPGYTSIQLGGHVDSVQMLRKMLGYGPTNAVGGR